MVATESKAWASSRASSKAASPFPGLLRRESLSFARASMRSPPASASAARFMSSPLRQGTDPSGAMRSSSRVARTTAAVKRPKAKPPTWQA